MRSRKWLMVHQLDKKLTLLSRIEHIQVPEKGWINTIRTTLNMTLEQLGKKVNKTRQAVNRIEQSEASGSISIKLLKRMGEAMDLKLVYGFVPTDGSVERMIELKAQQLAEKIVMRTHQNMLLEDQGTSQASVHAALKDLKENFKRELDRSLWD